MSKFGWTPGELQPLVACDTCAHKREGSFCDAFPQGIPVEILTGKHQHREPFPGDQGIAYKPKET